MLKTPSVEACAWAELAGGAMQGCAAGTSSTLIAAPGVQFAPTTTTAPGTCALMGAAPAGCGHPLVATTRQGIAVLPRAPAVGVGVGLGSGAARAVAASTAKMRGISAGITRTALARGAHRSAFGVCVDLLLIFLTLDSMLATFIAVTQQPVRPSDVDDASGEQQDRDSHQY